MDYHTKSTAPLRTSLLIATALVATVALCGNRTCVPIDPVIPECCAADEECGPGLRCVGDRIAGLGNGACVPELSDGCYYDWDCEDGICLDAMPCGCTVNCLSVPGHCGRPPYPQCLSSEDCGPDERCEQPEGDGCRPPDVPLPSMPVCLGDCVPVTPVVTCSWDGDCADDEYCRFIELGGCCLPGELCLDIYPSCQGECVAHDCATGRPLSCFCMRPQCPTGETAVIGDTGCWDCVDLDTCTPTGSFGC